MGAAAIAGQDEIIMACYNVHLSISVGKFFSVGVLKYNNMCVEF
jgi:hypothetical protein